MNTESKSFMTKDEEILFSLKNILPLLKISLSND